MSAVTERIVAFLGLSRCLLVEVDEQARQAQVFYDHGETHRPSLVGSYPISDFFIEDEQRQLLGRPHSCHRRCQTRATRERRGRQIGGIGSRRNHERSLDC